MQEQRFHKKKRVVLVKKTFALVIVLCCIILLLAMFRPSTLTGKAAYKYSGEERQNFAFNLNDWVRGFFQVEGLRFPNHPCTNVARELYENVALQTLSVTEDFSTHGKERVASIMFGKESERVGALELLYGKTLLGRTGEDSAVNLIAETPARIPKLTRVSNVELSLYGVRQPLWVYVTSGRLRTPTLQCEFSVEDDGVSCSCEHGRTYDYAAKKVGVGIYDHDQKRIT